MYLDPWNIHFAPHRLRGDGLSRLIVLNSSVFGFLNSSGSRFFHTVEDDKRTPKISELLKHL